MILPENAISTEDVADWIVSGQLTPADTLTYDKLKTAILALAAPSLDPHVYTLETSLEWRGWLIVKRQTETSDDESGEREEG